MHSDESLPLINTMFVIKSTHALIRAYLWRGIFHVLLSVIGYFLPFLLILKALMSYSTLWRQLLFSSSI